MIRTSRALLTLVLATVALSASLFAQDELDEDSKINSNLGVPITVPVSTTSEFMQLGTGVVAGVGYNFNQYHAFVGEFMWNWLDPTEESLGPLRAAVQSSNLHAHNNLFNVSANYRFEVRGKRLGTYLIGGAGVYIHSVSLSQAVTVPAGTPCTPAWGWWGFQCASGIVIVATKSSILSAYPGGNAGVGITVKVGDEPRYRVYVEARYHYVAGPNFNLRLIPVTAGIRF